MCLGLLSGLVAFVIGGLGWLAGVDAGAYDLAMRASPPLATPPRVAVVAIDDASIRRLGRWPWPWARHAELVRILEERYHPAAIAFDVLFAETDPSDVDGEFARAVRDAGNVYLAAYFGDASTAGRRSAGTPWLAAEHAGGTGWRGKTYSSMQPPVGELATAAAGVGPVNVVPELDGCIRRVPLVIDYEGTPYPSLMAMVANSQVNQSGGPVRVTLGREISFGGYRAPIDAAGEMLVSYRADPAAAPGRLLRHERYEDVLSGRTPPNALRGKVVIVGFGATGLADVHATPLAPGAFGVDISAQALNGVLSGSFVRMAGWPVRLGVTLALGLMVSLTAAVWRPGRALIVGLLAIAGSLGVIGLALWSRGVWMGAAAPAAAALCGYSLTVARRYRESEAQSLRMAAGADTLAHATRVIASVRQRSDLVDAVRAQMTEAMTARQTNLYLVDESGERLRLIGGGESGVSYAVGEGMAGWVARDGNSHLIQRLEEGSEAAEEVARAVTFPVGSVLYAPLRVRGQVTGVAEVVREAGMPPFRAEHLTMLSALAAEAGAALENAALYEQLAGRVEIANRQLVGAYSELRRERDRVAAILSNMADGVLLMDEGGRILFANPAAAEMLGVEARDIEGKPVTEALPYDALLDQLAGEPSGAPERIAVIRLEQPRQMILSPKTVRLADESGAPTGAVSVLTDVTLIQELSEMKTEFVSLVSHELRTPLTSIMGFAQTVSASGDSLPTASRAEFLGIIEQESHRLLVMINDLLDISRMEAGRPLGTNLTEVDLREVVEHVVRFQRVTTDRHEFRLDFPEDGLTAELDRDRVVQILTNLVSNAIKYSPSGGVVAIAGRDAEDEVVVHVSDQGVGMSEEEVGRLFQRFQRVDRDAIKGIRGTGLGLYLVRGLVEAQGGRIWVDSTPGSGSTFHFSLSKRPAATDGVV